MSTDAYDNLRHHENRVALRLLQDYFLRYWHVMPFMLLMPIAIWVPEIQPFSFLFMGFVMVLGPQVLFVENKNGVAKVYSTLPISQNTQSQVLWLEGAIIIPLAFLLLSPLALVINFAAASGNLIDLIGSAALTSVVSVGYSSILMILLRFLIKVNRQYSQVLYIFVFGCWVLLVSLGLLSQVQFLFFDLSEHQILLTILLLPACLVIASISYGLRGHPFYTKYHRHTKNRFGIPAYSHSRASFWFYFLSRHIAVQGIAWMILLAEAMLFALYTNRNNVFIDSLYVYGSIFLGIFLPILSVIWFKDIRLLRALPMSALKLSLFLLSLPLFYIVCAIVPLLFLYLATSASMRVISPFELVAVSLGASIISINLFVRLGESGTNFILAGIAFLSVPLLEGKLYPLSTVTPLVFILGLAMFPVLVYQIKNSSVIYRCRPSGWNDNIAGRP